MAKKMKDVTGDGKFTYADVLKMRGVKLKKQKYGGKVMQEGGRSPRMKEMKRLYVGSPFDAYTGPIRKTDDYMDRLYALEDQGYLMNTSANIGLVDQVANPEKYKALEGRGLMDYGGKVKIMKKGGTVDYFAGGALAAGLGQLAQRSKNPTLQKLGKVASTIGGFTPAGRAVNMAGNVLQNFIPTAGGQQAQQGVQDAQAMAQAAPQQGGGFANFMGSPVGQMAMQALPNLLGVAKHGMVVPNAKVRLLKLER